MKFPACLLAALMMLGAVWAAPEQSSVAREANAAEPNKLIIRDRDLKTIKVYQWERNGQVFHAWPGEKIEVPYDASLNEVKLYNFPTGQLRKLFFRAGARSAWHVNDDDIVMVNLPPLHQVEFVGNKVFDGYPGDVTLHPAGTRHHSETIEGGWKLEFAFAPQGRSGVDLIAEATRGKKLESLIESVQEGRRIVAPAATSQTAGQTIGQFTALTFALPGYTLIEAHYPRGEAIASHINASEKLAYVVSGRLSVTTDNQTEELGPGDMMRMVAGRPFARAALEDSVVIEIDGSVAPPNR